MFLCDGYIWWHPLFIKLYHGIRCKIFPEFFPLHCTSPLPLFQICFCRSMHVALCKHEEPRTDQAQEGISRYKVPQIVSTARVDLEDKDTCLSTFSIVIFLSWGVCIIHEKIRGTIAANQRRLFHSIIYTTWPC